MGVSICQKKDLWEHQEDIKSNKGAEIWLNSSQEFFISYSIIKTKIITPSDTQDKDIFKWEE